MSIWGKLAQIGLGVAAPFTGGLTAALIPAIGAGVGMVDNALSKNGGQVQAGVDAKGNPINGPTNSAYAGEAQALINNRARQATIDQAGPTADKLAMQNMFRAGLAARMGASPITLPGLRLENGTMVASPNLTPTTAGTDFANLFQQKLNDRLKAGKSLTLNGVQDASPEEIAANAKALDAAGIGSGVNSKIAGVTGYINQGLGLANLGKQIYDKFGKPVKLDPNYQTVGPNLPTTYTETGDTSNNDMFGDQ